MGTNTNTMAPLSQFSFRGVCEALFRQLLHIGVALRNGYQHSRDGKGQFLTDLERQIKESETENVFLIRQF